MGVIKIRKAKLHKIKKQALTKPAFHLPKKKKYTTSNDYYFYISNTDPGQFPVLMRALVVILKLCQNYLYYKHKKIPISGYFYFLTYKATIPVRYDYALKPFHTIHP